jgi:hypothetical protein
LTFTPQGRRTRPLRMADQPSGERPLADAQKSRVGRSPGYPWVSLGKAITWAKQLYNAQRKQDAHIDSVRQTLGYTSDSGSSRRAISALKQYGLTQEIGDGENRRIKLTEVALDLSICEISDPRWLPAVRAAALTPTIYQMLWERYRGVLPADALIRSFLIRDKGYNDTAADEIILNYRETFELAALGNYDHSSPDEADQTTRGSESRLGYAQTRPVGEQPLFTKVTPDPLAQEMPILVGPGMVARIPFPMTEEHFELFVGTLQLWKKKLVKQPEPPPERLREAKSD